MSTASPVISCSGLTPEQIAQASCYLTETRDSLIDSIAGLSRARWDYKTDADRWSIAEIVEHLILVEGRIQSLVGSIGDAPEAPPDWEPTPIDHFIMTEVPKRSRRVAAPENLLPTHHWSGAEAVSLFLECRERSLRMLSGPALRGRVVPHPVFGFWDGYQWLLAAAAHGARHTGQVLEVKANPNFPLADELCFTMQ